MLVTYLQRRPIGGQQFSIEGSFDAMRKHLPPNIRTSIFRPRFESRGVARRLAISYEASALKSDVYHVTGDIHYAALSLPGPKTVLTVHDCGFMRQTSGLRRLVLKKFWYDLPTRHVAAVTTVSEFTRDEIARIEPGISTKIHVVPTCISPIFVHEPKRLVSDPAVVLHVGTKPNKNLDRVAAALAGTPCRLVIVGALTDKQHAMLHAHKIDYATHIGITAEMVAALYRSCDVVSFPSLYEGFGMPILEAQATGRAIVVGNIKPLTDVAGIGACFVPPTSTSAIREAFARILSDERYRSTVIAAGLENVKRFSAGVVAQQYASIYQSIA